MPTPRPQPPSPPMVLIPPFSGWPFPHHLSWVFLRSGCGAHGAVLVSVPMGDIETYIRLRNSGIALVENTPSSPDELRALGADPTDAAELARLNQVYFGPTRFSGKQRKARHAALQQRHSLGTLTLIESYTAKVKKTLDAWNPQSKTRRHTRTPHPHRRRHTPERTTLQAHSQTWCAHHLPRTRPQHTLHN